MDDSLYFDSLECRDPEQRERDVFNVLAAQIEHARARAPAFAASLTGISGSDIDDRDALARLPVLRKSELVTLQRSTPPFGGLAVAPVADLRRVFASPGPIYEPEARRDNYWRMARALYAAGLRRGELVHNAFAYHLTPAGSIMESGAHALGCPVIPAGVGQTEQQLDVIAQLKPSTYTGTPSFLKILLSMAHDRDTDISSLNKALVSGEALPPSLRQHIENAGVSVMQCYAMADLGLIAYESPAREGLILDEEIIVEIVQPGTGDLVAQGEIGEVVVTTLNPDYPLIRFATGDLSAVLPGASPCGRTNMRITGWMGRADQTTKVRGMFVHPAQIAEVSKRHTEILRARLVVDQHNGQDRMALRCECLTKPDGLEDAIVATLRDVCNLRGECELVESNSLPRDGIVIDDIRSYE